MVKIDDTFAEAFDLWVTRVTITAINRKILDCAVSEMIGFATSVIGCGCEAGFEGYCRGIDNRVGANILLFSRTKEMLFEELFRRVSQCALTAPTVSVFSGFSDGEKARIGKKVKYFGDGFEKTKKMGGRRYYRIPVMEGEFLIEDVFYAKPGIGGGNIIIIGKDRISTLRGAQRAVKSIRDMEEVITPFPCGICRSGSKVGSRYKGLGASTNEAFCPTLKGIVNSSLRNGENSAYEIVIDGITLERVKLAMGVAILSCKGRGILRISAGNYGGKLGRYKISLLEAVEFAENYSKNCF